ncbi:MAG: 2-hydroxyacid dehydrogenase [Planctomycetota bacterium]
MRVAVFSSKPYDQESLLDAAVKHNHELHFLEPRLSKETATLANGFDAVCVFVNDQLSGLTIETLARGGVTTVALRCAGFNNVDLASAREHGFRVVRVPAYSPYSVAEHTAALVLSLNRKIHRAYTRVRDGNFALSGLLGFDLHGKTVGLIGTGKIGQNFARIMHGFGCKLLGFDQIHNVTCTGLGMKYVPLKELFSKSDIVSLHCPLTPETHHLIGHDAIASMKRGVMIVNSSRGAVIDTRAVIDGLKSGQVGHLGMDVYEEEADVFFEDLSSQVIPDDTLSRLLTFPNVLVTGHQGFFTEDALRSIAETTLQNLTDLANSGECENSVALGE